MGQKLRGSILLLIGTLIWGTAMVAQRIGMDYMPPLTFNGVRFMLGGIVLIPVIIGIGAYKRKKGIVSPSNNKATFISGLLCGTVLFAMSGMQQAGVAHTTVSKAGFITALYIVIVPMFDIFKGKKISWYLWVAIGFVVIGMYLLCMNGSFKLQFGDALIFGCAFGSAAHIILVDKVASRVDGVKLSCIQFFVCGAWSLLYAFIFEQPTWSGIIAGRGAILYTGILSCGIAYTFQILGQKTVPSILASLILSLESVFASLFGWIVLKQSLSVKEFMGCIIIFVSIVGVQVLEMRKTSVKDKKQEDRTNKAEEVIAK